MDGGVPRFVVLVIVVVVAWPLLVGKKSHYYGNVNVANVVDYTGDKLNLTLVCNNIAAIKGIRLEGRQIPGHSLFFPYQMNVACF